MNIYSNCWYETNIKVNDSILDEWEYPVNKNKFGIWNYPAKDIFKQSWLNYMEDLGVSIVGSILFHRQKWVEDIRAHIDTEPGDPTKNCIFGLNWTVGGKNSEMLWYDKPTYDATVLWSPAGLPYQAWPVNKLILIDKTHVGTTLKLVRTDLPHSIIIKNEQRWCFSARMPNKITSWEDSVEFFKSKNLLIER